jgi:hypothetical protein
LSNIHQTESAKKRATDQGFFLPTPLGKNGLSLFGCL